MCVLPNEWGRDPKIPLRCEKKVPEIKKWQMTTLLIKQLGFQCSRVAVADDERTHELKTRAASRTPASATGASDLLVGGGLVRARPPPTLLASGCASAPCGLPFQLGGDTALKKRIRRGMLRWAGHLSLEILIVGGWRGSAERGARGIQFFNQEVSSQKIRARSHHAGSDECPISEETLFTG